MGRPSTIPRYLTRRLTRAARWGERLEGIAIELKLRNGRSE